ncbi:MAG: tRNA uridine-5-carboxymethylaminomethyl(34) synthesis GTPase MnmE [Rhizomicrobium sp.]|jgi:tRNA modification GTPase
MIEPDDTIFALSSAPGRAGIAVVRVSGPEATRAMETLVQGPGPEPRMARLRALYRYSDLDADTPRIDHALVLWFPGPNSATGEDVVEFHIHGGRAVVQAVLDSLECIPGLRPAERGEFTRRAVENGKLDLTRAEALADLIDAETEAQRRQALDQYEGGFLALCDDWRARLIRLSAWAEAEIDFSDDELDGDLDVGVQAGLRDIIAEIRAVLDDNRRGEIVREGLRLTVVGPPNAGKSSLLNMLARRDVAIVSDTPGTTRDVVEVRLDIGGYLVIAADTAGLRDASGTIEAEGVRRALARAEQSDLILLLLDGSADDPTAGLPATFARDDAAVLTVWNKADLPWPVERDGLAISVRTGQGFSTLMEVLENRLAFHLGGFADEGKIVTRQRHRAHLADAAAALSRALDGSRETAELMAEDLRLALRAIGRITGRVDVEELLDVIFKDFCIGK